MPRRCERKSPSARAIAMERSRRIAARIREVAGGLSYTQIGKEFGVTKNAVSGVASRYGLAKKGVSKVRNSRERGRRMYAKAEALFLERGTKLSGAQIAEVAGCSKSTALEYRRRFEATRGDIVGTKVALAPVVTLDPASAGGDRSVLFTARQRPDGTTEAMSIETLEPEPPEPARPASDVPWREALDLGDEEIMGPPPLQAKAVRTYPSPGRGCHWPIGEPHERDFRFCGERRAEGRPYCAEHTARAFVGKSKLEVPAHVLGRRR